MNNIRKILVPVDFSAVSETALDYVSGLIKGDQSITVTLLHISKSTLSETERKNLEQELKKLISQRSKSIPTTRYEIQSGSLIDSILQTEKSNSYSLIVMGTGGGSDEDTDTNTSELVLQAECPVLVVPESSKGFAMKNIALALGQSLIDNSGGFQVLHDIAREFGATVHILTIKRDGENVQLENKNQEVLEYYLESLLYFHAFPQNSDLEMGISDYIREKKIDMLAIVPRNHVKNTTPSEGRLTKLLTLHADVPLLTID